MNTLKKRALATLVLAFGMATTIATSAVEYEESQDVAFEVEDGGPITIMISVDAETAQHAGVGFELDVTATETATDFLVFPDDPEAEPYMTVDDSASGVYGAEYMTWSDPITCSDEGESCTYLLTIEPIEPGPYRVSGRVLLRSGTEIAEDAVFLVTSES